MTWALIAQESGGMAEKESFVGEGRISIFVGSRKSSQKTWDIYIYIYKKKSCNSNELSMIASSWLSIISLTL